MTDIVELLRVEWQDIGDLPCIDNMNAQRAAAADEIERLRASLRWQPIETAPKDEVWLIGRMGVLVCTMGWDEEDECWFTFNRLWEHHVEKYGGTPWMPSHWMPIPKPPEGET